MLEINFKAFMQCITLSFVSFYKFWSHEEVQIILVTIDTLKHCKVNPDHRVM